MAALPISLTIRRPFLHPIETATNLYEVGKGVLQMSGVVEGKDAEKYAQAVGSFLKDRYGSLDAIKRTAITDPVGLAADASVVLGGCGTAAARLSGLAGRVGEIGAAAGRITNPLSALAPVARIGAKVGSEALGLTTGAGGEAIRTAAAPTTPTTPSASIMAPSRATLRGD